MNTLADSIQTFAPVISLEEKLIPRRKLTILRTIFFTLMVVCATTALLALLVLDQKKLGLISAGTGLIFLGLWLEQVLVYTYHNSFYFRGLNSIIGLRNELVSGATYEVAQIALKNESDVTFAFCTSTLGSVVLLRAGADTLAIDAFLREPRQNISADMVLLSDTEPFSLSELGSYILAHDSGFKTMLQKQGVLEETFLGALHWVSRTYIDEKRRSRWWSKDNLSRTEGIGREWSYGATFYLDKFSRSIRTSAVFSTLTANGAYAGEKIAEIEATMARAKAANILLVGEPGVGKMDLVMEVERRIHTGLSLDAVAGKRIIALDTNRLFAVNQNKSDLENTILRIFNEAYEAGNVIVVIENLSAVIREAEAVGVFLPELLDQYLSTSNLHIIATDTPGQYHTFLEPLGGFVRRFTEILIETPDLSSTIRVLEGIALQQETVYKTIFTHGALEAIAVAADRYIVEGDMPDKAVTLLITVASEAASANKDLVGADFVYEVVSKSTGVPAGPIKEEERDLLLHLETTLHQQVVGQERALDAIARTMRRARAGIQSSEKPIGSFLFLGPTGVGKTETAKALAKIFFGSESKMHRLDMSEFSGGDALSRLIGDGQVSGSLSDMLHEHPYSVLLLDEFEKADRSVHDLFLQVLDEGFFTDARGERINARNTIIIATSNAGSQLIMRTVAQREQLAHLTQDIIDGIIRDGVFRPELINRFDSTIIFEPLTLTEQGQVASLMLGGLYERVKVQGYDLKVGKDLMDILVEKGYSPQFGARPMQRVLQDIVEEKVAQKIIAGTVQKGDSILLTRADFTDKELAVVE